MYCKTCGTKFEGNFCPKCGERAVTPETNYDDDSTTKDAGPYTSSLHEKETENPVAQGKKVRMAVRSALAIGLVCNFVLCFFSLFFGISFILGLVAFCFTWTDSSLKITAILSAISAGVLLLSRTVFVFLFLLLIDESPSIWLLPFLAYLLAAVASFLSLKEK